jgi:hypothetical protein
MEVRNMSLRKQIVISGVAVGETAGLDLTLATLHNAANIVASGGVGFMAAATEACFTRNFRG